MHNTIVGMNQRRICLIFNCLSSLLSGCFIARWFSSQLPDENHQPPWDALEKLSTAPKLRLPPRPACLNNISKAHKKIRTFSPKLCTSWARRTKAPAPPTSFSKLELSKSPARCAHETYDFNIHTINCPASRTTPGRFELVISFNL